MIENSGVWEAYLLYLLVDGLEAIPPCCQSTEGTYTDLLLVLRNGSKMSSISPVGILDDFEGGVDQFR